MDARHVVSNAPAKINLALHVVGQREDGYHLLESVVCFVEIGDEILIQTNAAKIDFSLFIKGPFSAELNSSLLDDKDNLVLRAAHFAASKNDVMIGKKITLTKNLPISSGIGGGSADAAATIRAIAQMSGTDISQDMIAASANLGADVPMCLHSKPLIARGIGDEIELLTDFPTFHLLLVNPNVAVSTPQIFKTLTSKNNSLLSALPENKNWVEYLSAQRNDLEKPAIEAEPVIANVINTIKANGALLARLSGSGATCFGIFENAEACDIARMKIADAHPNWWCVATKTLTQFKQENRN